MQEGIFTKIGAVATVIGLIYTCFSPAILSPPDYPKSPVKIDFFDKNPLYTISSGAALKNRQDVYLPAYQEIVYIQNGKFILDKENIDEKDYVVILKLNGESGKIRKIPSGKSLKITDSSRHGPEDREYRHTYTYIEIDHNDIGYLKCLGKDNFEYITIGQFKKIVSGVFDVNIPDPKEI